MCYFAVVQDPPMYLDFEPDDVFDRLAFKEFTREKKYIYQISFIIIQNNLTQIILLYIVSFKNLLVTLSIKQMLLKARLDISYSLYNTFRKKRALFIQISTRDI
jgi:hypothetical protein